jgi:hypothetical protein
MRKKILRRAIIGFFVGICASCMIGLIVGKDDGSIVTPLLVSRTGSEAWAIVIQMLLVGLYSALTIGSTVLYDHDNLPLTLVTIVHYLIVALPFVPVAWFLGWMPSIARMLQIELMQFAGYFLIWLGIFLHYKAQVRELNELLEKQENKKTDRS